jgi:hypothetical protein
VVGFLDFKVERRGVCKGCAFGEHAKVAFPISRGILDQVHSDVCEPMSSTLLTGKLYYVIFMDDCSRKTWIYFMKTKDEVFNRF